MNLSDWFKGNGMIRLKYWKCNVYNFQRTTIDCNQLFKLKSDDGTTNHFLKTASQGNLFSKPAKNCLEETEKKEFWSYKLKIWSKYPLGWEISSVYYKCGFSGPGHLGFCRSIAFMNSGAPSELIYAALYKKCTKRHVWRFFPCFEVKLVWNFPYGWIPHCFNRIA